MSDIEALEGVSDALVSAWRTRHSQLDIALEMLSRIADFIRRKDLIIYGGLSIDMALRADNQTPIYPDDAVPDYDFYSPNHARDAYELADELVAEFGDRVTGFRVALALHVQTLRLRCDAYHEPIADISFIPPAIFEKIPTVSFHGVRCVHPHWQFVDQHLALSSPFGRFPGENIFFRWKKDMARHRMLYDLYPLPESAPTKTENMSVVRARIRPGSALCGISAVAALAALDPRLSELSSMIAAIGKSFSAGEGEDPGALSISHLAPKWHHTLASECEPVPHADLVSRDTPSLEEKIIRTAFRPTLDVVWPYFEVRPTAGATEDAARIVVSKGALVPVAYLRLPLDGKASGEDSEVVIPVAGPQVILKQLAAFAVIREEPRYWSIYKAVHELAAAPDDPSTLSKEPIRSYWQLSSLLKPENLLGDADHSHAAEHTERKLRSRLRRVPDPILSTVPSSYRPKTEMDENGDRKVTSQPPTFAPAEPWFTLDGSEIIKK